MTNQLQQKTEAYSESGPCLSPATNPGGGLLHVLDGLVSALLGFLVSHSWSLLGRGLLLSVLSGPHGLLPLSLSDLGLLVPLGHDVLEVAPTTARWNFWVLLFLFLETSSSVPFLCFLLYSTVQEVL